MVDDIRDLTEADAPDVLALFMVTAESGTLGRDADEYTLDMVAKGLGDAAKHRLCLGAFAAGSLVGMVRAARLDARRFQHVVTGITLAVHPAHQGRGLGRVLLEALLARCDAMDPPVIRVELMLQTGNPGAQRLYGSVGFAKEGVLRQRVRGQDGEMIDDLLMARVRPTLG